MVVFFQKHTFKKKKSIEHAFTHPPSSKLGSELLWPARTHLDTCSTSFLLVFLKMQTFGLLTETL